MPRHNFIDMTGARFGRLVVMCRTEDGPRNETLWICSCDCGNQNVVVRGASLRRASKPTRSCGCLIAESTTTRTRKAPGESGFTLYLAGAKRNAIIRALEWPLTDVAVRALNSSPCFYCGKPPCSISRAGTSNPNYTAEGIARVARIYRHSIEVEQRPQK